MPRFKKTLVWQNTEIDSPITLWQTGLDRFTVEYGKQVKKGLKYGEACDEIGTCLMHALSCAGKIRDIV